MEAELGSVEVEGRGGPSAEVRSLPELVEALRTRLEESAANAAAGVQAAVRRPLPSSNIADWPA